MGLEKQNFLLSDQDLAKLNRIIQNIADDYYKCSLKEDPLDGMSVIFNFVPGFGRQIEIQMAGRCVDIEALPDKALGN